MIVSEKGIIKAQHHYLAFGTERPSQLDATINTRAFTGHERDAESGLDYMVARYYSSSLARFMAVDPALKVGKNLTNPQRWNRYTYTLNNPLSAVDPDGREEIKVTITTSVPQATVNSPGVPIVVPARTFGGDSPCGTFRTQQTITVETDPSKRANPLVSSKGETGPTHELNSKGDAIATGKASGDTLQGGATRGADGSVTVSASGNEANPLVSGSPGITYGFSLTLSPDGSFQLSGSHDGFPGYTVDVTRADGTTGTIYSHDPQSTGEGVGSLFPPAEHKVDKKGTTPGN